MEWYKINKTWIGVVAGILLPLMCYSLYWIFFQRNVQIDENDIRYLINKELNVNVFKMCCGTDLILFYLGLNKKLTAFTKGIIASVVIYALVIAYLTFFSI